MSPVVSLYPPDTALSPYETACLEYLLAILHQHDSPLSLSDLLISRGRFIAAYGTARWLDFLARNYLKMILQIMLILSPDNYLFAGQKNPIIWELDGKALFEALSLYWQSPEAKNAAADFDLRYPAYFNKQLPVFIN